MLIKVAYTDIELFCTPRGSRPLTKFPLLAQKGSWYVSKLYATSFLILNYFRFNLSKVTPALSFHSIQPFALRANTTAAAVLGALNN